MPQYEKKRLQLESFYEHRTNQANTIINLIKLQKLHSRTQPLMWICRYSDMLVGSCCRVHTPSLFFFFFFLPKTLEKFSHIFPSILRLKANEAHN